MKALYEKIIPPETSSFKAYAYEKEAFDTPWHYHPEYELTYITASRGVRYVGSSFENFEEDDLVLLGPNLPHCWKNNGPQPCAGAIVFHWGNDLLGDRWQEKQEFKSIHKLLRLAENGLCFERSFAQPLKEKLLHALQRSPLQKLLALLSTLEEMAVTTKYHVLSADGFSFDIKSIDHERLNTVQDHVGKHYAEKITLKEMSSRVHMTEESFSRFFSKIMGKPFFYFLNEYRIRMACQLLIASDLPVVQVAFATGFESLPFFHRQFKKYKHCSPGEFRKNYRGLA